ncbi:LacI family DNA-binding transcriptional regulator [Anaerobium acetethylicum]|uniref:LacI family transcriptional regulator, sucrose operon repressor n=1 Tax=Anaerobium acetethylicum TaxID=1619234 RepID=A0A1D3TX64_9FIRM|nr:LacI family DNA-binding transcriptional regulator [Anaerobium acetethylicum]SCP98921.1 LacI family transcriptional regulator, sucrose operon repressor [Anaerobium acetethylicum]
MAGIKDVAKIAHVGVGTVSRVINNSGYTSEETREKVEKAMQQLRYTPNELARNLYRKRTGIIAVLVPDVGHPFFAQVVKYVEIELNRYGYKTMICNTTQKDNNELEYLQMLERRMVDGVITGVHSLDIHEYLQIEKPIVALDRYIGNTIPVVSVDHKKGGQLAAEEMLRTGSRIIIQFQGASKVESPSLDRHIEFEKIMTEHGITVYSYEMEWNRLDTNYSAELVNKAYMDHPEADGVFGTDLLALEYMKKALIEGKKVPEDLKVICYDGTYITNVVYPEVTVIRQPIEELAKESVRLMNNMINGKLYEIRIISLQPELIRRRSTQCD